MFKRGLIDDLHNITLNMPLPHLTYKYHIHYMSFSIVPGESDIDAETRMMGGAQSSRAQSRRGII